MRTLFLVCLACLPSFGQTAQSPPKPKEFTKEEKRQGGANQKKEGALPKETSPSDAQLNRPDQHDKPSTEDQKSRANTEPDWWMIGLTGGLVLVGGIQDLVLIRQTRILNEGLTETRHATELTRRSLILAQRPRLIIRNIEIDVGSILQGTPVEYAGTLEIYNGGGSNANVTTVTCKLFCFDRLPMKAPFSLPGQPSDIPLPPGFYGTKTFDSDIDGSDFKTFKGIVEKTTGLYIMGELAYTDDLALRRTKRFCRLYDYEKERFFPVADPDYETED